MIICTTLMLMTALQCEQLWALDFDIQLFISCAITVTSDNKNIKPLVVLIMEVKSHSAKYFHNHSSHYWGVFLFIIFILFYHGTAKLLCHTYSWSKIWQIIDTTWKAFICGNNCTFKQRVILPSKQQVLCWPIW